MTENGFSKIARTLAKVQTTEFKCDRHGILLLQYEEQTPFCMACTKERIAEENEEMRQRALQEEERRRELKKDPKEFFKRNSMISDQTLLQAEFDNYQTSSQQEHRALEAALGICERIREGQIFNALFTGPAGSGKSHLAMAIAKNCIAPNCRVLYAASDELMRKIRDTFNNKDSGESEESYIDRLASAEVLVLDDLGAETGGIGTNRRASDFTQNVLYSLMNRRQGKVTIITTNLSPEEIVQIYDSRLASRLLRGMKGNAVTFAGITDKRIFL